MQPIDTSFPSHFYINILQAIIRGEKEGNINIGGGRKIFVIGERHELGRLRNGR
jgi:hypothetical protein